MVIEHRSIRTMARERSPVTAPAGTGWRKLRGSPRRVYLSPGLDNTWILNGRLDAANAGHCVRRVRRTRRPGRPAEIATRFTDTTDRPTDLPNLGNAKYSHLVDIRGHEPRSEVPLG